MRRSFLRFTLGVVAWWTVFASQSIASEPQIAFTLEDGWVSFTLTRDGQPVPNARVIVFNRYGGKHAEGETGAEGGGIFPMPRDPECWVEVTVGDRIAERIRLQLIKDRVIPSPVLLRFEILPCCRLPTANAEAASESSQSVLNPWLVGFGLLVSIAGLWVLYTNMPSLSLSHRTRSKEPS